MLAIYKKELKSYFYSPIGYLFISIFMLVSGIRFVSANIMGLSSDYTLTLDWMSFVFMLTVPLLTMRLLAEERRTKSDQLLLTSPLKLTSIITGKFLAALSVLIFTLLVSFVYPLVLDIFGAPDYAAIISSYVGFALMGTVFIAVGVFVSASTDNQVSAAVLTFAALFILYMLDTLISAISAPWLVTALSAISVFRQYVSFGLGILGLFPIIYFASATGLFLFLAVRAVEKRRWSEG